MSTLFPGDYDSYTNPTASDTLDSVTVPHATQHTDLNDAMEAVQRYLRRVPFYPPFTPSGDDDEFDDGSFSGWTAVQDASPTPTLTEDNDRLSIYHPGGDAAAEMHAWVKARTVSANDWIEIAYYGGAGAQNFNLMGLIFSDGTTYGAGAQVTFWDSFNQGQWTLMNMTNFNTFGGSINHFLNQYHAPASPRFMRLMYLGSNTWRGLISADGITWVNVTGDLSRTLTPTHVGFLVSTSGGASPFNFGLHYARFGNG